MELKEAKYLDSILMRGGTSTINVDDVPDDIIRMLATYRYIRIVDKRSDGIAYLVKPRMREDNSLHAEDSKD